MASLHPLHRPLGTQWPHHLPDHITGSDTVSFTFTTKHTVRNGEGSSDSRMLDDQFCSLSPHCWGICLPICEEGGYRNVSHYTESQMRAEWESGVRGRGTQAAVFPSCPVARGCGPRTQHPWIPEMDSSMTQSSGPKQTGKEGKHSRWGFQSTELTVPFQPSCRTGAGGNNAARFADGRAEIKS